jgi:hypothetical protein
MVTETPYEQLRTSIRGSLGFAYKRAIIFGAGYYITRVSLIVLSALASAKAVGIAGEIDNLQSVFSLRVAILAALDTGLKIGERYRVHYQYDDQYRDLRDKLALVAPDNTAELSKIAAELADTRAKYRKALSWA